MKRVMHGNEMLYAIYECDGRYKFLESKDIVKVENQDNESSSVYFLRITHVENVKLGDYFKKNTQIQNGWWKDKLGKILMQKRS